MNTVSEIAIKLNVPGFLFQSIENNPQLLFELLAMESLDDLTSYLFEQLKDKDGSPEFSAFKVHFFQYNPESRSGKFRLKFAINRRFCCSETEGCSTDYLDFDFVYSQECITATANYFNWSIDN